jgi:hypothetical protein
VNIGFSAPTVPYNTAIPGEEGFYCRVIRRPTAEFPDQANVRTPTAYARFRNAEHAMAFLEHPGALPLMSRTYLDQIGLVEQFGDSEQLGD